MKSYFKTSGLFALGSGLLALAITGCASTSPIPRAVSISVVNIVPTSASMLETTADLTLRINNDSGTPIFLGGGAHRLFLNNTYVGRGVTNAGFSLPALSTSTQTFQVHIENLALFNRLWNLRTPDPVVSYRVESEFPLSPGERHGMLRAATTGTLDLGTFAAYRRN